tara:strand:+ start:2074 stop:3054 length:981 start_codon:yes stop_codon:yes gene_type:complete
MKSFLKISLIYLFIFELIFQFLIFFNFKYVKIPDLFYNGYCNQKYWNFNDKKIKFDSETEYHPILSYVKKDLNIPSSLDKQTYIENSYFDENQISLYGSSYINHKEFKSLISNNSNFEFKNYALNSYGLDQIYLSYKLTAHMNQNRIIVIGFLLEDLDRSIFYKRDYEKVIFRKKNGNFILDNTPIENDKPNNFSFDLYLFRFLGNFYSLFKNDFDPRLDDCKKNYKIDLFNFYLNDMKKISKKFNQKLVFVTFNLKEDLIKEPTWRYNEVKKALKKNNITHIDSLTILRNKSENNIEEINTYFGLDKHNNIKSFAFIIEDLFKDL